MIPKTIVITNKTNIRYLSGFAGTSGYVVMHEARGFLFTDARYHLVAKKVLSRGFSLIDITGGFGEAWKKFLKKYRVRACGFEGGDMSVRLLRFLKKTSGRGVKFVDVGEAISERRVVKKPAELALITKAQKITDEIFSVLKQWLKPGVSECEIAWKIEALAHEFGADDISFPPIIGINEHSASPHHKNTDRKLKRGDLILVDMGVIYKGYCSDMTRMIFTRLPTAEQEAVYKIVLNAQETAIRKLRAGVTGVETDQFARDVIKKAGYGDKFGHSLGHGVGMDVHELPNLSQKYSGKIPAGSVVTVEPGVYLPSKFGMRLEDMVVVGRTGVRNLTRSSKAIQETVIRLK